MRTVLDCLLAAVLVALLMSCSGCAALKERERRFMPVPTIPTSVAQTFADDCAQAIAAARGDSTAVPRMVDSCSALTAINCGSWIDTNILAEHGILMRDGTAAAIGAGTTIAAGAFSLSPGAVAGVGVAQMIAHLFGQVEKTGLGAPEGFTAQQTMLNALDSCTAQLVAKSNMSFAQAVLGVDRCRRVCTNGAASAITTQALQQSEVVMQNGALSVVSSSYQKDDSGARIIGFWMRDGTVNAANEAKLKAWMTAHGVSTSIPFLAHSKLYEAARKQAVADLNIPEAAK